VYRARDTKLKRDVAIKVLPAAVARDPDRLARFEREARLMASLDHPNIGAIYGLEETNNTRALVLALIDGPTLADRIATGPVPLEESIHLAGQIAEALEYAHDRGVIHRDLKPANVKITPEGTVKVLDFGLAKALTGEADTLSGSPANSPAMSPTLTMRATQAGMILGTAAYMAPEQAKGKTVDRRADIWAFGVVFFEMLTGEPLFTGDSAAEIMASAIKEEPKLDRLSASTPPAIRGLIERCLNKDPKQRLQAIGEARITLQTPNVERAAVSAGDHPVALAVPKKSRLAWITAVSAILALAALSWVHFREVPPIEKSLRFQIAPPDKAPIGEFRLSPDGRHLAFISGTKVWVRSLDSLESKSLDGSEGATYPFWSPDSENLGFFSRGKLKRIPRIGGPVQTLCDAATGRGATWSREGVIVFSPGPTATLFRVSAAGGAPVPVTKFVGSSASQGHRFPEFLPDGQHFLYAAQSDKPEDNGVYVGGLDGTRARILPEQSSAIFAPGPAGQANGYILFRRLDTLMAQPFDAARLRLAGDVFPVSDRVGEAFAANTGFGAFSLSADGTLVLGSGESGSRRFVWFDRSGKRMAAATEPGNLVTDSGPTLSPDGKKLAYVTGNNEEATIWLQNLAGGSPSRFTFAPGRNSNAVWSPDGSLIVFSLQSRSTSNSDLIVKPAHGAGKEELLLHAGVNGAATDWSRDGKLLAYSTDLPSADLWLLPLEGERKPVSFLRTPFAEMDGHFSPDAKFLVYKSDESGQGQIYVQPVPPNGSKWQVSKAGGANPTWRRDWKEIFYVAPDQKLMAAPVKTEPAFEAGTPQILFEAGNGAYIPSADGQRFLVVVPAGGEAAQAPPLTVVTHWQAGLKK